MNKVFGALLENAPQQDGVPRVVKELINYLTEKPVRLETEGIFRVPGKLADINEIKRLYDNNLPVDLSKYDVHTVAGALKTYFRELPDSLMKRENTGMILATIEMHDKFFDKKIKNIQVILSFLPILYYNTLKLLIHYLSLVVGASQVNKMNITNVSMIFAVNIFTGVNVAEMVDASSDCFSSTRFLIENWEKLFNDPKAPKPQANAQMKGKRPSTALGSSASSTTVVSSPSSPVLHKIPPSSLSPRGGVFVSHQKALSYSGSVVPPNKALPQRPAPPKKSAEHQLAHSTLSKSSYQLGTRPDASKTKVSKVTVKKVGLQNEENAKAQTERVNPYV
ncbi:hypothetical protein EIN_173240 [Entamoeba invadens IP1]|uniref:Rho-GAP domain-containing protein n=1 Tax=Entamoeba invadens IP1 TaxID=370355 RepID=A0A0A1TVW9_ENTIV|nr:hypothetical protein EIN_173240 [Entamoeba invadens IP1]ELP84659.1 hypothetical protein EIN_173240 [Entamoeba invadens IP1]|eukprot:XP_004184005.1 hypothetical protein EIN_173240 [Entamoeba invadens IP1]